ncbi:hypothetical protein Ancab_031183 [Ancistrocladus abbreviatus]
MPSKTKKQPKTPSRLSQSDASSSPNSSSATSRPTPFNFELNENELLPFVEEASRKFPSFISKRAFIGRITEVDVDSPSKGCRIWLSESSMTSSSISPGSIVSVALAPSGKFSNGWPLTSLTYECSAQFAVDCDEKIVDKAGNYFVLAAVFPSSKVLKNGVRLSSNLSYSMGSPASGRYVFIQPIHSGSVTRLNDENGKLNGPDANCVSSYNCKELYLEILLSKRVTSQNGHIGMPSGGHSGATLDLSESGEVSSPQTPLPSQSRLCSPRSSMLSSLASENSAAGLTNMNNNYSFDIREMLGDESARKLLQRFAALWLCSRHLLCGNLVTVPMLSMLCVLKVMGADRCSDNSINQEKTQSPGLMINTEGILVVYRGTEVRICLPSDSASLTSAQGSSVLIESKSTPSDTGDEVLKLGGLWKEYTVLKDIILSSAKNALSSLGLRATKGVLLHGAPGTGKTSLAQLCARDSGVKIFKLNGPEIVSQYYGESEQALHEIFNSASQAVPSVIFIDELDAIAPARNEGGDELSQRMVATLLNLMDGICQTDGVLVIAATNRPEIIEPALRRPGRLDREIEIGVPSPDQRLDILVILLSRMDHSLSYEQIQQLAVVTHGFVGADLGSLCDEAAMVCLRRHVELERSCCDTHSNRISIMYNGVPDMEVGSSNSSKDLEESFLKTHTDSASSATAEVAQSSGYILPIGMREATLECTSNVQNAVPNNKQCVDVEEEELILQVAYDDFEKARMKIRPSAMREVMLELPKVKWDDVGGQQEVKRQLMEAVEWPQKHQDAFQRIGTRPPTGVLMFGPPGCSKTLMARAVASEAGLNFLAVKGPELFSKWVGESEKAVRSLFAKARANAPSIIFFDEIDSLAEIRGKENDGVSVGDRVMSQLLVELDGLQQRVNVTVIAATNRPDKIDPALLRPGRFDRLLYVGPPNEADREEIFRIHLRKMPCSSDIDVLELARLTRGCTGADISLICMEAANLAMEECIDASEIKMEHLRSTIKEVRPSEIQPYHELSEKFQRAVYSENKSDELASETEPTIRSSWTPIWNPMKRIMRFICQLPAAFSWLKLNASTS